MTLDSVMDLAMQIMAVAFEVVAPILALSMSIGIAVAVFQAATQIQESSLQFVPKLVGMGIAVMVFGGWILDRLGTFTVTLLKGVASVGG